MEFRWLNRLLGQRESYETKEFFPLYQNRSRKQFITCCPEVRPAFNFEQSILKNQNREFIDFESIN